MLSFGGDYVIYIEMATGDEKRLLRNTAKRLAYASMNAEKKAGLLAKQREYRHRRLHSTGPSSGTGRFDIITNPLLCYCLSILFS